MTSVGAGGVATAGVLFLLSFAACSAEAPASGTQPASSSAGQATEDDSSTGSSPSAQARAERVLDPLTYTLLLGDQRRDRLPFFIRVENRSGDAVTDPGCRVNANYSYGLVPAADPGEALGGRVMTKCAGEQVLPNGYGDIFDGPTFLLAGLPDGKYLATIDFGDARSARLSVEVVIDRR